MLKHPGSEETIPIVVRHDRLFCQELLIQSTLQEGEFIPNKVLKGIFIVLAIFIGLRYTLRGFFGINII